MAMMEFRIETSVAWWVGPYIYVIAALCSATGMEPNLDRMHYWIMKGITVRVTPVAVSALSPRLEAGDA